MTLKISLVFATILVVALFSMVSALKCVEENTDVKYPDGVCPYNKCFYAKCNGEASSGCLHSDFADCDDVTAYMGSNGCSSTSCIVCETGDYCNKPTNDDDHDDNDNPLSPPAPAPVDSGDYNPSPPSVGNDHNGPAPTPAVDGNGVAHVVWGFSMMLLALLPVVVWMMENF